MSAAPFDHDTAPARPAPLHALLVALPIFACSLFALVMPLLGSLLVLCTTLFLLVTPFTARKGSCPHCDGAVFFPFNGYNRLCRGCRRPVVLRHGRVHPF